MSDLMNNDMSDTFEELRGLIKEGMSKEGILSRLDSVGYSYNERENQFK